MSRLKIRERRWSRKEYDRLIELGILHEDEPIELLYGQLVVAEPQNVPHAKAIELAAEALRTAFGAGWRIRVQLPLALDDDSEPEPDIAVVRGAARDPEGSHPQQASLVVEVADTNLRLDRGPKAALYARAGIAEYWIVNLVDRVLEIYRDPEPGRRARYRTGQRAAASATITPLAAPTARIAVTELLP